MLQVKTKYNHWIPKLLRVAAITLYPYVFIAGSSSIHNPRLLSHELEHVRQVRRDGWLCFYVRYLWEYFVGLIKHRNHNKAYRNISYEIKARQAERLELTATEHEELGLA